MKLRLVAAVVISSTLVFAGSASSSYAAPAGNEVTAIPLLTIGSTFPVPTLDMARNGYARNITQLALDTLMKFGPDGQVEPDLASSVTQPNAVTYVYHLRHGVKFWDGSDLTSADVVYSLDYQRAIGSAQSYFFASVKSIAASGPDAVVVTLTHPDASWQYGPPYLGIFEMKFAEAHKAKFGQPGVLLMGSGPWEVQSLDPTTGAELTANPNWWGGHCYGARLTTDVIPWVFLLAVLGSRCLVSEQRSSVKHFAMACGLLTLVIGAYINGRGALSQSANDWVNGPPEDVDQKPARVWDWSHPQFLSMMQYGKRDLSG